jgi:hypothetical protein
MAVNPVVLSVGALPPSVFQVTLGQVIEYAAPSSIMSVSDWPEAKLLAVTEELEKLKKLGYVDDSAPRGGRDGG